MKKYVITESQLKTIVEKYDQIPKEVIKSKPISFQNFVNAIKMEKASGETDKGDLKSFVSAKMAGDRAKNYLNKTDEVLSAYELEQKTNYAYSTKEFIDAQFKNTSDSLKLIEEADLIFTHIFPYSPRLGTPASKMKQLDRKIIKERTKILRQAGEKQLEKYLANQVGKKFEILLEKNNRGKTSNFLNATLKENLDLLTKNNSHELSNTLKENSLIQVKVVDYNQKELIVNLV